MLRRLQHGIQLDPAAIFNSDAIKADDRYIVRDAKILELQCFQNTGGQAGVGGEYSGEISFRGDDENSKLDIVLEGLEDGLKETVTCYGDNKGDTPKVTKAGWENDEFKYEIRVESDDNSISLNEKDAV